METPTDRAQHWVSVYETKSVDHVSWFQAEARTSVELIEACSIARSAAILDVGAGASTLVDGLVARRYTSITLLDIAEPALAATRQRLNDDAPVRYLVGDVLNWRADRAFDVWHDRAVFHFLTDANDRDAYRRTLQSVVPRGGHVILATFALDGPERCSGLPVRRYSADTLESEFRGVLRRVEERAHLHVTPSGNQQRFVFVRFERL